MLDFPHFQTSGPRRRWARALGALCAGLSLTPGWVAAQVRDAGLPLRNLVVEWRIAGQGQVQDSRVGVRQGRVIIDSQRGVVAQGEVQMGRWQTETQTQSVQQVQVLNGGRARLFVGRSQPYTVWQWAYVPAQRPGRDGRGGAVQAWGQTEWLDLGQGLNVRPQWPGGQAPVTVELDARASTQSAYEPDGQVRYSEVVSTVAVPLGEWAVVARSGRRAQQARSGTLSTEAIDDTQSEQLEIRITAP